MSFVSPFDMAFDDTGAIVIDILHRLVRKVDEWDVVEIPLVIIKSSQVGLMVQNVRCLQMAVRWRVRSWI